MARIVMYRSYLPLRTWFLAAQSVTGHSKGQVHVFGSAMLGFADGIRAENSDIFGIGSPTFGLPLINPFDLVQAQ